jgi:hypothetical protein
MVTFLPYSLTFGTQREGMGLLEYLAMPSLCDVANDRLLCTLAICTTAAGNSISSQLGSPCQGNRYGMEKAGGTASPAHTKSHLPGHSPPASQTGRRVGPSLLPSASLFVTLNLKIYGNTLHTIPADEILKENGVNCFKTRESIRKTLLQNLSL